MSKAGVHLYMGKVKPAMKEKTDDGKLFNDCWFMLEGKGANRGSVLKARCRCKGGHDGGCKHIAALMYSLEDEYEHMMMTVQPMYLACGRRNPLQTADHVM